jgi:hypothetical protein
MSERIVLKIVASGKLSFEQIQYLVQDLNDNLYGDSQVWAKDRLAVSYISEKENENHPVLHGVSFIEFTGSPLDIFFIGQRMGKLEERTYLSQLPECMQDKYLSRGCPKQLVTKQM